jgi:hypothetical protein
MADFFLNLVSACAASQLELGTVRLWIRWWQYGIGPRSVLHIRVTSTRRLDALLRKNRVVRSRMEDSSSPPGMWEA